MEFIVAGCNPCHGFLCKSLEYAEKICQKWMQFTKMSKISMFFVETCFSCQFSISSLIGVMGQFAINIFKVM